jgi:hypothetical protein
MMVSHLGSSIMQGNANANSVEPPVAPQIQRIMITSQTRLMITTKRQFFMKAKTQSGISRYDTLTNLHVKCQMPQALAQVYVDK